MSKFGKESFFYLTKAIVLFLYAKVYHNIYKFKINHVKIYRILFG